MSNGSPRPNPLIPDFFIADMIADAVGPARARGPSRLGRAYRTLRRGVRLLARPSRQAVDPSGTAPRP